MLDNVIADTESYSSKEEHENAVKEIMNDLEEIKNHLMNSNMVVTKDTKGIIVKDNS